MDTSIAKDALKAAQYYEQAAQDGVVAAMVNLGVMYELGNGVPQCYELSMKYFTNASKFEDALALYHLSKKYEHGTGVENDDTSNLSRLAGEALQRGGKYKEGLGSNQAAAQQGYAALILKISYLYGLAFFGMRLASPQGEMRHLMPPQTPNTTLSAMPNEILMQIFCWLHPKQCILLRRTSRVEFVRFLRMRG
ncbi:hypothetical protein BJ741DRAFT_335496 [Chytriomyces cf. hyalinus JEL632]|nr:hypothetical protein BJ741DRAFT_335496 [Chytriomyces cf. hyalinus JEL632]